MFKISQTLLHVLLLWVALLLGALQAQLEPMRVDPAPVGVDPAGPGGHTGCSPGETRPRPRPRQGRARGA